MHQQAQCAELHQHPRDPLDPLDGEDEEIDDDLEDADEHPDPGSRLYSRGLLLGLDMMTLGAWMRAMQISARIP